MHRSIARALTFALTAVAIWPLDAAPWTPPEQSAAGACRALRLEFFGGLPLIQVRVNGSPPAWFLLDTASSFTFVNASTAQALGLRTAGGMTITGGGGSPAEITFAEDVGFDIGGVELRSRAAVMPLQMKYDRPLGGILGAPFFQQFVTQLDFAASTLHVCDPAGFTPPPDGECIRFRIEEGIPLVDVGLKLQGRDEIVAPVFVDTGASQALGLNRPFVAAHRLAEGQVLEDRRAGSLTGPVTYQATGGATVRIGTRLHTGVMVGFWPSERTNRAGVIGNAILRNYLMGLDYRTRCMYLQDPRLPNASPEDRESHGRCRDQLLRVQLHQDSPHAADVASDGGRRHDATVRRDGNLLIEAGKELSNLERRLERTRPAAAVRSGELIEPCQHAAGASDWECKTHAATADIGVFAHLKARDCARIGRAHTSLEGQIGEDGAAFRIAVGPNRERKCAHPRGNVLQNKWTRAQPGLAKRVQELVTDGYDRQEIASKLGISRYLVDRLRGGTEPEGGMPMRRRSRRTG